MARGTEYPVTVGRLRYGHPVYRGQRVYRLEDGRCYLECPDVDREIPQEAMDRLFRRNCLALGDPPEALTPQH